MKNSVEYTPTELVKMLADGFGQTYKPFAKYRNEQSELWTKCISTISDNSVLEKIIFCNDIVRLPPVKVFLCLHPEITESKKLTAYDKKFLGGFFSYIFTVIFCYKLKKQVGINNPCIRTALYFYDRTDDIVIVPDTPKRQPSDKPANANNEVKEAAKGKDTGKPPREVRKNAQ